MSTVQFSQTAKSDLRTIARFTTYRWGKAQAKIYITEIKECCQRLTSTPMLGRIYPGSSLDLRRFECGSHVIFYRQTELGIFIARILHQNMLPLRHHIDDRT